MNEGYYEKSEVSDDELWAIFSSVFSNRTKNDTSYKFGFFKSIIDNLYNVDIDLKISFDTIFCKFAEIYWNLVLKYQLKQKQETVNGRVALIEKILLETAHSHNIIGEVPFEKIGDSIKVKIYQQVKAKCKVNVVGAFFTDTNSIFYSFSKKEEWIKFNPSVYKFVSKNKLILEKLNYYEWAKFLEKVNNDETTINLLNKLDCSGMRNDLSIYRKILYEEFENQTCFYCGKSLNGDKIDVDHFIPWSFIKDDNLWNLVLSCPSCNKKKSDKLPIKYYLDKLVNRNDIILLRNFYSSKMKNYNSSKLKDVYEWAAFNGYSDIWNCG